MLFLVQSIRHSYFLNPFTTWMVCNRFSGPYFPAFGLNTPYLSTFSPNAGKYGPEKLQIRTLSTQWFLPNVLLLYPPSITKVFWCFWGIQNRTLGYNGLNCEQNQEGALLVDRSCKFSTFWPSATATFKPLTIN